MRGASLRARRGSRIAALALVLASSGCWIVAGLEDRTLRDGDPSEAGTNVEGGGDGSGEASADGSTDGGPKRCEVDDPFESGGTLVAGLASPSREFSATLSEDELEILVSGEWDYPNDASIAPTAAIWRATRPSRTSAFTNITRLPFDNGTTWGSPTLADDAGVLYVTGSVGEDPFTYQTKRIDGGYSSALIGVPIDLSETDYLAVDTGNETIYFAQKRDGRDASGPLLMWKKTLRPIDGGDASPAELTELSAISSDGGYDIAAPVISRDKDVLYFVVSERQPGAPNRVFRATATPKSAAPKSDFAPASIKEVAEVNVDSIRSFPVWVSPDLCRLYVSQLRGPGARDLYVYEKKPR